MSHGARHPVALFLEKLGVAKENVDAKTAPADDMRTLAVANRNFALLKARCDKTGEGKQGVWGRITFDWAYMKFTTFRGKEVFEYSFDSFVF